MHEMLDTHFFCMYEVEFAIKPFSVYISHAQLSQIAATEPGRLSPDAPGEPFWAKLEYSTKTPVTPPR